VETQGKNSPQGQLTLLVGSLLQLHHIHYLLKLKRFLIRIKRRDLLILIGRALKLLPPTLLWSQTEIPLV
jgi:hypothetical protein